MPLGIKSLLEISSLCEVDSSLKLYTGTLYPSRMLVRQQCKAAWAAKTLIRVLLWAFRDLWVLIIARLGHHTSRWWAV